jgi:amino acid transporter
MKLFKKCVLVYTSVLVIITYMFGWGDLIGNKQLTGNLAKDFFKSITYYFTDVLIYWWLIILIGVLLLTIVTILIYRLFDRFRKR